MINSTASVIENNSKKENRGQPKFLCSWRIIRQNLWEILSDNWSFLKKQILLKYVFEEKPITAYRWNKNLGDNIGGTIVENNKVMKKQKTISKSYYCEPYISRTNKFYCKETVPSTTSKTNPFLKLTRYFIS